MKWHKSMKWRQSVLSTLLLGFLPLIQPQALETDTFIISDLTGHLSQERQQLLTRQAQTQLDQIRRFYGEPPQASQMEKIHLEFDQPRNGVYATVFLMHAKRRAKLSRVLGKRALKCFHPGSFNVRHFAGEPWSDQRGTYCRTTAPALC